MDQYRRKILRAVKLKKKITKKSEMLFFNSIKFRVISHRWLQYWNTEKQLKCYLDEVAELSQNEVAKTKKFNSIRCKVSLICLILVLKCVQALCLCLLPMDELNRLLNYDMMLFWQCDQGWNLFTISCCAQVLTFLWVMYFKSNSKMKEMAKPLLLTQKVLFKNDDNFFIRKYIRKRDNSLEKCSEHIARYSKYYRLLYSFSVPFFSK